MSSQDDILDVRAPLWKYVSKSGDYASGGSRKWECNFCRSKCHGSYTRVRAHLLGEEGKGIKICNNIKPEERAEICELVRQVRVCEELATSHEGQQAASHEGQQAALHEGQQAASSSSSRSSHDIQDLLTKENERLSKENERLSKENEMLSKNYTQFVKLWEAALEENESLKKVVGQQKKLIQELQRKQRKEDDAGREDIEDVEGQGTYDGEDDQVEELTGIMENAEIHSTTVVAAHSPGHLLRMQRLAEARRRIMHLSDRVKAIYADFPKHP